MGRLAVLAIPNLPSAIRRLELRGPLQPSAVSIGGTPPSPIAPLPTGASALASALSAALTSLTALRLDLATPNPPTPVPQQPIPVLSPCAPRSCPPHEPGQGPQPGQAGAGSTSRAAASGGAEALLPRAGRELALLQALLGALGPRLHRLELGLPGDVAPGPAAGPNQASASGPDAAAPAAASDGEAPAAQPPPPPAAALAVALPLVSASCPALSELVLELGRPPPSSPLPSPPPFEGWEGGGPEPSGVRRGGDLLAAGLQGLTRLTGLSSLDLSGPGLPALLAPPRGPACLLPLASLRGLRRLRLPLAAPSMDPSLDLSMDPQDHTHHPAQPPPKSGWILPYGAAVRGLLVQEYEGTEPASACEGRQDRAGTIPPAVGAAAPAPASRPANSEETVSRPFPKPLLAPTPLGASLTDLDLGPDLVLVLPYIPYDGLTALTRLAVGELSSEWVSESQWDLLPERPGPLPPGFLHEGAGHGAGGQGPAGRLATPLTPAAIRLPPRLRELQVRFLPDVAVLSALEALPALTRLTCTAVRHPHGEICLDLAAVGVPGPPDLSPPRPNSSTAAASTTSPTPTSGLPVHTAASLWLPEAVQAAARLLARMLGPEDWARHALTLRPSPFSFLRGGYERLRWGGPHGPWLGGLVPLAGKVTRLRAKHMALRQGDVEALAEALPGLQALALLQCDSRAADRAAWRAALGARGCGLRVGEAAAAAAGGAAGSGSGGLGQGQGQEEEEEEEVDMFGDSSGGDSSDG
ncbi:hypothetical protein HYH03_010638 [Edaphochlamys debaryana]|uniref:Uncharacterized protein n=1 Tax=Edaphochlamys debaryana TaxID=47281 RepID=A0A836BVS1_9CHLO|nr:hypothetical protein HYH03_010638 [Edaphochlamys debaryana]|eukprot:KAG2490961.1 hypothetical protein HYH03_010638 [Edaphochlamys debaryana]